MGFIFLCCGERGARKPADAVAVDGDPPQPGTSVRVAMVAGHQVVLACAAGQSRQGRRHVSLRWQRERRWGRHAIAARHPAVAPQRRPIMKNAIRGGWRGGLAPSSVQGGFSRTWPDCCAARPVAVSCWPLAPGCSQSPSSATRGTGRRRGAWRRLHPSVR